MERKTPTQFSLLEMLLVFALLTTLVAYLLTPMKASRSELNLHLSMWAVLTCLLAGGMYWVMSRRKPSIAKDWWLIGLASLVALVNGFSVGNGYATGGPFYFELAVFCFFDLLGMVTYWSLVNPRPHLLAIGFHLIMMAILLAYNIYVFGQILAEC